MSAGKTTFTGTPSEIGADAFIQINMPMVRVASKGMTPAQLAQLYSGFIGACFGSMAADFGTDTARLIVNQMAESFATAKFDGGMVQ